MHRWSVERWLQVLTFIGVVLMGTFGLGAQWNETSSLKASVNAINAALGKDYVRADVYAADQRRLSEAIDRLTRALEAAQPPARTPVFERGK